MPRLTFDGVGKRFGDVDVIADFNAEIGDEEFLVLLGPSGCGKSTMLRMIAGLTDVTTGEIRFDDDRVNELEPRERNVAFVFQSYALYPHMTVRDNIAFPLIMDRFKRWYHIPILNAIMRRVIARRPEVSSLVEDVAATLELGDYLSRRPKALSGGQRQRVAVARALVRDPVMYLLDEPLSNLDAKLRSQMRAEISALHRRVRKTFVYVTHDQVEAMTMATKVIVMDKGNIQQIGTPEHVYAKPANTFVARFIGSPPMNLIPATVSEGRVTIDDGEVAVDVGPPPPDGQYLLGIRPERIGLSTVSTAATIPGLVRSVENLGGETVVGFRFAADDDEGSVAATSSIHYARIPGSVRPTIGAWAPLELPVEGVSWFDRDSGERVEDVASVTGAMS